MCENMNGKYSIDFATPETRITDVRKKTEIGRNLCDSTK